MSFYWREGRNREISFSWNLVSITESSPQAMTKIRVSFIPCWVLETLEHALLKQSLISPKMLHKFLSVKAYFVNFLEWRFTCKKIQQEEPLTIAIEHYVKMCYYYDCSIQRRYISYQKKKDTWSSSTTSVNYLSFMVCHTPLCDNYFHMERNSGTSTSAHQ